MSDSTDAKVRQAYPPAQGTSGPQMPPSLTGGRGQVVRAFQALQLLRSAPCGEVACMGCCTCGGPCPCACHKRACEGGELADAMLREVGL